MRRVLNFSAGPAVLPEAVMARAKEEMLDWNGTGMSVMEMSHRSPEFVGIAERAEADFRELMNVPDDYHVLFLQGGATAQFGMVPLNLLKGRGKADYFRTGNWSKKAIKEAKKYAEVNVAVDASPMDFQTVPKQSEWQLDPEAAYVHYTPNETVGGVEFHSIPDTGDVPLVADMSSAILSRPLDVSRFGLIYAGAQKNIGPAGMAIVIVHKDLVGHAGPEVPTMFDYKAHADADSMLNTPPTFTWYMAGLVFDWLKQQGGLEAMAEVNSRKSEKLYAAIDESDFYANPIDPEWRSRMNVPFTLADDSLNDTFLEEAKQAGMTNLKGHRSVGGMRASIYNAMPEEGVDRLIEFMHDFERRHG